MAKNTPKNTNKPQVMSNLKNPKIIASIIVIILLLVVVGALMMSGRKDTTTKVTSASDLAKSSVNTKNTKTIKPKTAADAKTTTAAPTTPAPVSGAKKTTTTTGSTTTTTAPSTPPSGGGATTPPAAPTPVPFAIEGRIYSTVDNGYTNIGCNETTRFTTSAYIVANGAGTATYHWERSDGAMTGDRTIVFSGAGTQIVTNSWDLSSGSTPGTYTVNGWQKVVFTEPNSSFSKASDSDFTLAVNCM